MCKKAAIVLRIELYRFHTNKNNWKPKCGKIMKKIGEFLGYLI